MGESEAFSSLQSLQHIRTSELYPKTDPLLEDDSLTVPFIPLCGENTHYVGHTSNGTVALSTYRLYLQITDSNIFYNIPLGLIEAIEVKDILCLHVSCKDARIYRLSFSTNERCLEWMRRLIKATSPTKNVGNTFAFAFYAWATEEGSDELLSQLTKDPLNSANANFYNEVERLQFDVSEGGPWRISKANSDFRLCSSYPRHLLVPACFTDQALDAVAKFRSARRVPAVVWRHRTNGAVIARSSQPEVGWLGWRSSKDEELLKAIAEASYISSSQQSKRAKKLLIMDARSYTSAVANRARGGGCECPEYYPNCDIRFMNLANIHSIRKSFSTLRSICSITDDQPNWFSLLEGTRWLHNMSGLIQAAVIAASAIENDAMPVLVHCSDGWDRTPEIVSLAQILLDPYYRTLQGFQVLVEREWLEFGHKFADRCGGLDDYNERCPVFLQWLDCVHNIAKQYPCAFQFNSNYLVKLAQHTYSNMFGTFLCNNIRERRETNVANQTFSVWSLLLAPQYVNHLYCFQEQVLWPSFNIRDLELWKELYLEVSSAQELLPSPQTDIFPIPMEAEDSNTKQVLQIVKQGFQADDAEYVNGEDLNGNGEEQNNHIEVFDFQPISPDFKEDEDNQHRDITNHTNGNSATNGNILNSDHGSYQNSAVQKWNCAAQNQVPPRAIQCLLKNTTESSKYCPSQDDVDSTLKGTVEKESTLKTDNPELETVNSVFVPCKMPSNSAQSSTETLIPVNVSSESSQNSLNQDDMDSSIQEISDHLQSVKISNSEEDTVGKKIISRKNSSTTAQGSAEVPIHTSANKSSNNYQHTEQEMLSIGRSPPTLLDPIDGLSVLKDDIQQRLTQMVHEHKVKEVALERLERELHTTRLALLQQVCHQCTPPILPERPDDDGSVCSTEVSWEAVEENDTMPTRWVPDYAVSHCQGCHNQFWLGRRKHHCRSCGKIFCADCSENAVALPEEQLYEPVRVCTKCFNNPVTTSKQETASAQALLPSNTTHP